MIAQIMSNKRNNLHFCLQIQLKSKWLFIDSEIFDEKEKKFIGLAEEPLKGFLNYNQTPKSL